jgi:DNA-binding NarL/FixJ family response regulator
MGINVAVCGEHTFMRVGVRALLESEPHMKVREVPSTGRNAVSVITQQLPDVVVSACALDQAVELARDMRARPGRGGKPKAGVVALITHDEEPNIIDALRTGVRGVVRRDGEPQELVRAVRAVAAGYASITPSAARILLDWVVLAAPPSGAQPVAVATLTRAELRVLILLANGLAGPEVADQLGVSDGTVRSHVHHVLTKLGLRSRSEAVAFAFRHGLVSAADAPQMRNGRKLPRPERAGSPAGSIHTAENRGEVHRSGELRSTPR